MEKDWMILHFNEWENKEKMPAQERLFAATKGREKEF